VGLRRSSHLRGAPQAYRESHIGRLYQRLQPAKGHGRAVVAVARHLAEASFWMDRCWFGSAIHGFL
jgi:hypothetical protein